MKIQCDVCNEDEASVYCSADEAALCAACDHRVHHANKLAGKHPRFSLLLPTPKDAPLCDICQEKRAFLFCQQDRAILCKDCDIPIHKVNEHTQKHNRFLLTGVKLSATSALYSPAANSTNSGCDLVPDHKQILKSQKLVTVPPPAISNKNPPSVQNTNTPASNGTEKGSRNSPHFANGPGHGSTTTTSSISEYLIEMLPGWHVEDFLDSPPLFSKSGESEVMPFWDGHILEGNLNSFSPETMGMWVPQAPQPPLPPPPPPPSSNMGYGQLGSKEMLVFGSNNNNNINTATKSSRKWRPDDGNCFTVPQISPPSTASKRSRTFWH